MLRYCLVPDSDIPKDILMNGHKSLVDVSEERRSNMKYITPKCRGENCILY